MAEIKYCKCSHCKLEKIICSACGSCIFTFANGIWTCSKCGNKTGGLLSICEDYICEICKGIQEKERKREEIRTKCQICKNSSDFLCEVYWEEEEEEYQGYQPQRFKICLDCIEKEKDLKMRLAIVFEDKETYMVRIGKPPSVLYY